MLREIYIRVAESRENFAKFNANARNFLTIEKEKW